MDNTVYNDTIVFSERVHCIGCLPIYFANLFILTFMFHTMSIVYIPSKLNSTFSMHDWIWLLMNMSKFLQAVMVNTALLFLLHFTMHFPPSIFNWKVGSSKNNILYVYVNAWIGIRKIILARPISALHNINMNIKY